ncbi:DUF732 domain-containing protein [Streptacidiphilus fuscans]|uniref:DUF732 domain-containing protein n=1 Tax=Streptacidiphilus fuscans TaxID=2789292 RepID=A0A931FDT6_9ACTN|nr:DUF732 domain-containing protein [Streptacidiphilus fuscans]MBF9069903.1 hypothetical protein [Streptacidiphilus fuscans]
MNLRRSLALTTMTLALLAVTTSLTSPASCPETPSSATTAAPPPTAAAVSAFLRDLHTWSAQDQPPTERLGPGQSPDAQLVSAGVESCADLQTHTPTQVMALLTDEGWSQVDAAIILLSAAQPDTLCPVHSVAVIQAGMGSSS